jgi:WD40 repeat protein
VRVQDVMVGIHQTLNKEQYATVSRDGAMHVYTSQLKLLRKIRVSDPVVKVGPNTLSTPGYIISTARMPVTGTVGVASMRRAIRFYDPLALTDSGALVLSLPKAPRPITCINAGALGHGKELLLRGDEEGHVELYSLHPGWTRVEGQAAGTFDARRMAPFLSTSSYLAHPGHWVTHAAYIPDLGPAVVSSGTDSRLCLLDFEADKIKWSLDASKARGVMMQEPAHTKGIRTWDWSDQYNFFATAGLEREVRLWSAFVNKPIGTLEGVKHGSARIVCNEAEYQILSLGLDKTVSIWDIRTQRLVEVIQEDRGLLPEDSFTAMLVDNDNKQLIVGSGKPQMHTARRPAGLREVQRPTVAVAVCDAHMLVATADEGNEVRMWRAGSGRAIFAFSGVPPESTAVVTTLAFDAEQLRLLVAANDGFVRLFNHGNGMVLKTFRLEGTPDVAALLSVHLRGDRHLFAATESAEVYAFLDTQDRTSDQVGPAPGAASRHLSAAPAAP